MNLLLLDVGNTHTHLGLAIGERIVRQGDLPTQSWCEPGAEKALRKFLGKSKLSGVAFCSVVPKVNSAIRDLAVAITGEPAWQLTSRTVAGIGIDYPKPDTIGADRLANSIAAIHHFGAPCLVVDFGTAVTFDVVDKRGSYIGGIIAPGLSAMTDYLHEKTALLPKIEIRKPRRVVGKNTEEAMLSGAVFGYRGLVIHLLAQLRKELRATKLPVVATGGYAKLIASGVPEILGVIPGLTLEGLRLAWAKSESNPLSAKRTQRSVKSED